MSKTTIPAGGITDGTLTSAKLDQDGAFTFNEDSADADFRVESNGNANMLFVSGGNDVVGIGSEGDLGVGLHVKTSDTSGSVSASADQLVLEANSDMGMTMLAATSGECFINFGDSGDNDIGQIRYHHSTNHMSFHTNAVERVRINGTGEVSVGDTSSVTCRVESNRPGTGEQTHINFNNGNGTVGTIKTSGSGTQFNTSSDYRLKENEVAISDGITRLKTLKPYRFNFKADTDTTVDGFFAHEVSNVVPEAISGEKDGGEMQGIDQSKLVPLLTAALQEAITEIESLKARVTTLEG
jgi:hypothetical protein